jgi:hypothetical protein
VARYNEILVGHLNRGLQKHLQMKGEPPAPQLASEIQPALNLYNGVENRYVFGWNKFSISTSVTGGAAQFAGLRLRNPTGSGAIAVIEYISVSSGAVQQMFAGLGPITGDLTTVLTAQRLDARRGSSGQAGTCVPSSSTNTGGAFSPQIGTWLAAVATPVQLISDEQQEIPLLPGDAFQLDAGAAASQLVPWIMWRERFLEESERS